MALVSFLPCRPSSYLIELSFVAMVMCGLYVVLLVICPFYSLYLYHIPMFSMVNIDSSDLCDWSS